MEIKTRKGFLFVVTVFLILTYILLSISVWVQSLEASERSYSELYKESSVELIIDQITPPKVNDISNVIMTRGMFVLNRHSVDHTMKEGSEYEHQHIESALEEYLKDGAPSAEHFNDGVAPESEYNASLGGWMHSLNVSLIAVGAYIDHFEIDDFEIEQNSYDTVDYSFNMSLSLRDTSGTTTITRTYPVEGTVNITGYVDPAAVRESDEMEEPVYRQFFFYPEYGSPAELSPDNIEDIESGQGWFYGPLIGVSEAASLEADHRHRYIIVGTYSEITSLADDTRNMYGGYIVTNSPGKTDVCSEGGTSYYDEVNTFNALQYESVAGSCEVSMDMDTYTFKPYIVAPGFSIGSAPECPDLIRGTTEKCALMIAEHTPEYIIEDDSHYDDKYDSPAHTGIYGIEDLRDYTLCGYYVPNENAPSYLQRLMNDSYSRTSIHGIETFFIGEYMKPSVYDEYGRLGRNIFNGTMMDELIRGMPGCKNAGMCTASGVITGHFGLTSETIDEYGAGSIDCGDGAECG